MRLAPFRRRQKCPEQKIKTMKNRILVFLLALCGLHPMAEAQDIIDEVTVSFPYETVGGKIRIKVFLSGDPHYFIFNTGAKTLINNALQEKYGYREIDPLLITGASGEVRELKMVSINSMSFENHEVNFSGIAAIVGESPAILAGTEAVGMIGNDVLSQFIVEIDSRERTIRLLPKSTPLKISLRNMVNFEKNSGTFPIFLIGLDGGATEMVLFDTSSPHLLTLKRTDNERIHLPMISIGMLKLKDITAGAEGLPVSLLGSPLLDYGKVTIDYPRSRFFFEPYER